jgi:hypothetical protein
MFTASGGTEETEMCMVILGDREECTRTQQGHLYLKTMSLSGERGFQVLVELRECRAAMGGRH